MTDVCIVSTGTANMASVGAAFRRLGVFPFEGCDADQVEEADFVVVPGVGTFAAAMEAVERQHLRETLTRRIDRDRPTLAVCVGMQILATGSEESPGVRGLGIIDAKVERFGVGVKIPQLGWNQVEPPAGSRFLSSGWAYFANSFRIAGIPDGWTGSMSRHGDPYVSSLERGRVLALQFHPELSGPWGQQTLRRWLDETGGTT